MQRDDNVYYQSQDWHFTVQNNDGLFSCRRGGHPPSRIGSEQKQIRSPEAATFFYVLDDLIHYEYDTTLTTKMKVCVDYQFSGYLYFKIQELRWELAESSLQLLDDLEEKSKVNAKFTPN